MQVARQEQELAAACKASDRVTQGLVHRMLMELETGGNIRSASSALGYNPEYICTQYLRLHAQYVCIGVCIHIASKAT